MYSEDLCKLGKEYLYARTCNLYAVLDKILKLLTYHTHLSAINHRKVINSKKQSIFVPPHICICTKPMRNSVKAAFHDTDTDILTRIFTRKSRVSGIRM